jgi:hypothetical protein
MFYADSVRKLRQREYDNIELYNEIDQIQAEQKEKSQENFVKYFEALIKIRHKNNSESIKINWERAIDFLISYEGSEIPFSKIDIKFCENFKTFFKCTSWWK